MTIKEWNETLKIISNDPSHYGTNWIEIIEKGSSNSDSETITIWNSGSVLINVNDTLIRRCTIDDLLSDHNYNSKDYVEFDPVQVIKSGYIKLPDGVSNKDAMYDIYEYVKSHEYHSIWPHAEEDKPDIFYALCGALVFHDGYINSSLTFYRNDIEIEIMYIDDFHKMNRSICKNTRLSIPFKKDIASSKYLKVLFITNIFGDIEKVTRDAVSATTDFLTIFGEYKDDYLRRYYPYLKHTPYKKGN